jgi:hypothetical protein
MTDRPVGPVPLSFIRPLPPFQEAPLRGTSRKSRRAAGPRPPPGNLRDPEWIKKNPATTYSPTQLPEQYHRHGRA